jgi:D-beta-D-heptose 7-phosphate kinase / D-beta-D-heptose 1-phosphate adenosyltransferase
MRIAEVPGPDLAGVIQKLARTSVLVVGDAMLDRFVSGTATRLSPEAPVPVLTVEREVSLPGGAGNVVRNLTALGAAAALVSVVGDDQAGSDLTGLIGGQANVEPWLLVEGSRCTTVKTRFVADGQQLLRADSEVTTPINAKLAERMLRIVGDSMTATNVTVLSDYGKGVLAGDVPARLIAAARETGRPVVVDTRGTDLDRFAGADVVVLTTRALEAATGMAVTGEAHIASAARWLRTAHGFGGVVVNRRADGFCLVDGAGAARVPPAAGEPFNFTGASDTAVAAVAAALAAGLTLVEAVRVASLAVSVCASQAGVPVASAADLLAVLTPQGQALRKIVPAAAAAAQIAHWRRAGLRTGVLVANVEDLALPEFGRLRHACDRLTLCVADGDDADLAAIAAQPDVDLVCAFATAARRDTLIALRPDVLLAREAGEALQALVESWGGSLVLT